ncbi:ribosome biogenesis protein BMS1 homolog isoform X2 [Coccinella septempunctata]|uniref:ribosome biogenesis protein BMS1 homolog isoform X2 n=1 Tax=Coccinella septempunctata TaxID=41139 RepID=UPI001D060A1E|nr:ribosome biogenesis protein BMS1 homolog isoform X2 [Coccinella septempunctata]
MENIDTSDKKKAHRDRRSGRKAEKKKAKDKNVIVQTLTDKQRNPKAFGFNSAVKAERQFRRKQDVDTKKQHIPLVDRTPIEPPPIMITVVGPPKVGKTTLIKNLIKLWTKAPMTSIQGPVSIVIGKKRRITLMECNNDINCMIDLAKVTDLVLLLCDANFGFEMEVFEFLNICQVHGMPRIMGVLNHLDMIKNSKKLKTTKKTIKHRFWTEVYPGAKLFYLSGIIREDYLKNEIKNLGRFISVMKFRPLTWRSTHSYLLVDRLEDLTNEENVRNDPKCDRNISLYGYIRGVPLKKGSSVHIAGLGDMRIHDLSFLPDPCPLPEELKKRALIDKEKMVYAPFSGMGGIVYDKDAVYVELGGSHSHKERHNDDEVDNIVTNLIDAKQTLDTKMQHSELQLFTSSKKIRAEEMDEGVSEEEEDETEINMGNDSDSNLDSSDESDADESDADKSSDESDADKSSDESDADESSDESDADKSSDESDAGVKWKENLAKKAQEAFLERQSTSKNWMKLVYGVFELKIEKIQEDSTNMKKNDELGSLLKAVSRSQQQAIIDKESLNAVESSLVEPWNRTGEDWTTNENKMSIKNCFVTGEWKDSEDANELLKLDAASDMSDVESEVTDFEDLESGEKYTSQPKAEKRKRDESVTDDKEYRLKLAEKKRKLKERFDEAYDTGEKNSYYDELKCTAEKQAQLNKTCFENMPDDIRTQIEGFRPGMYVRMEFQNIPSEFITNFDPTYPVIVGSLNISEDKIGYVNVKIKKHRWYSKILKTADPLILSLGWRRFQTVPLFSKMEDDLKFRYLKYTPEHLSCNAHFWGPMTPQRTGFLALQSVESNPEILKNQGFRIAATGVVQELDKSTAIMKKLKLIGYPMKIHKKTAFIKDMFNSSLEVAKFEGAKIKTVSGIRGQIKKPVSKPEGVFRATFEDQIKMSDIVFCRTWYKVDVPQFYNPITNLLLPIEQKNTWKGARTTGEIKQERSIKSQINPDHLYEPIVREEKPFAPLVIPRKLQASLPYRDKPKHGIKMSEKKKGTSRVAVVLEPHEQKVGNMMKMIKSVYNHKQEKAKQQTKERLEKHRQYIEAQEEAKNKSVRKFKKEIMRKRSKKEMSKEK